MLGIFARSFMKATHQDDRHPPRWEAPRHWTTSKEQDVHKRERKGQAHD